MGLDNDGWVTELVESFSGVFSPEPKLGEELVGQSCTLVFVYPYGKSGTGSVVGSGFANCMKRPVDFEGSEPSMRGLLNLRTGPHGHSYRR